MQTMMLPAVRRLFTGVLLALFVLALSTALSESAPLHPDLVEKWQGEGVFEEKMAPYRAFFSRLADRPPHRDILKAMRERKATLMPASPSTVDTFHVLAILVDFDDRVWTSGDAAGTAADFDSILFSDRRTDSKINPTGSMTD